MGLFSRNKKTLPLKKTFIFHNQTSKFDMFEDVKLWLRPNTNQINFFEKGTYGGQGLIGNVNDKIITFYVKKGDFNIQSKVISINNTTITIGVLITNKTRKNQ